MDGNYQQLESESAGDALTAIATVVCQLGYTVTFKPSPDNDAWRLLAERDKHVMVAQGPSLSKEIHKLMCLVVVHEAKEGRSEAMVQSKGLAVKMLEERHGIIVDE